ncbi:MAG: hypothetical protein KDB90_11795 [Planctomycetes bacterium]|nr:hypothetical protein [Planctomycetota bacterium]
MSLTPDGVSVSAPVPMGAPTIFGGVPPLHDDPSPVDLTEEFALEDESAHEPMPAQKVESLAAVEPFGGEPMAVDIPFDDVDGDDGGLQMEETVGTQDVTESDDLDLDLSDLEGDLEEESVSAGVDIPEDDAGGLGLEADSIDIPADDEPGFNADAMTMLPPTRKAAEESLSIEDDDAGLSLDNLSLDDEEVELDADGNPKAKFKPGPEDTLPVWTGKASSYKDPNLEKKKKETSKLNKAAAPAAKSSAKPLAAAKLPGAAKKPITKQLKKPVTGAVGPSSSGSGRKAAEGAGNFTVFLSPPKGADKKQAAAEIIAEIQGIDMNSAIALAGKMIVPVVKGVSEDEAQGVRDRFKDAGLS